MSYIVMNKFPQFPPSQSSSFSQFIHCFINCIKCEKLSLFYCINLIYNDKSIQLKYSCDLCLL